MFSEIVGSLLLFGAFGVDFGYFFDYVQVSGGGLSFEIPFYVGVGFSSVSVSPRYAVGFKAFYLGDFCSGFGNLDGQSEA